MRLKRAFDIVFSLVGLVLALPFLVIFCNLVILFSSRPAIFRQIRTGRYGKPFTIFKFRTMRIHSVRNTVSVLGDERVTPLGAWMRKYKIDELPELWNILKGDMSFVGPRPDLPEYTNRLAGEEKQILLLRPGLIGPATLKYLEEEEILSRVTNPEDYNDSVIWPDKVRINLDYYYNRTFLKDMRMIVKSLIRFVSFRARYLNHRNGHNRKN
jgi:lipopolysaccharide/colanic/teichoic acid biosynthesis glycosyltransferase